MKTDGKLSRRISLVEKRKLRTLDVRPLFVAGVEPLPAILAALSALGRGESLLLITPFLPSPLIERVHSDGFDARPERRLDGSWITQFTRGQPGSGR
jgi:uncharacterized protein (DUF2249 family)